MKKFALLLPLCAVLGCAPAEQTYCDSMGIAPSHPEYQKCTNYYFQQQSAFQADRDVCEFEADKTYPPTLYDRGGYERVHGGFGYGGWGGYGGGFGSTIYVEPDYYHNREVDHLRMRIIEPCMQARGWNSGASWQAGRHAGKVVKAPVTAPQQNGKLPWLK